MFVTIPSSILYSRAVTVDGIQPAKIIEIITIGTIKEDFLMTDSIKGLRLL